MPECRRNHYYEECREMYQQTLALFEQFRECLYDALDQSLPGSGYVLERVQALRFCLEWSGEVLELLGPEPEKVYSRREAMGLHRSGGEPMTLEEEIQESVKNLRSNLHQLQRAMGELNPHLVPEEVSLRFRNLTEACEEWERNAELQFLLLFWEQQWGSGDDVSASEAEPVPASAEELPMVFPVNFVLDVSESMSSAMPAKTVQQALPVENIGVDQVEFAAVAPKEFLRGEYTQISLVVYEEQWRSVVERVKESFDSPVKETGAGVLAVGFNTWIRAELRSPAKGIEIPEPAQEMCWNGKYLEYQFLVAVSEDYAKRQIPFQIDVYFNDVIATKLSFTAKCVSEETQNPVTERIDIRSVFMSYASQDRSKVAMIIQGLEKARPDLNVYLDVEFLRSGELWKQAIEHKLKECDLLYLCWSEWAKKSIWVDYEWRSMLRLRGIEGIEPIPLVDPERCPPPKELESKHFNDRLLPYWSNF